MWRALANQQPTSRGPMRALRLEYHRCIGESLGLTSPGGPTVPRTGRTIEPVSCVFAPPERYTSTPFPETENMGCEIGRDNGSAIGKGSPTVQADTSTRASRPRART